MTAVILHILISLHVVNISKFDYINSLSVSFDRLYIGAKGGIVVYDILTDKVTGTLTGYDVSLATPDPSSNFVYFVSEGALYRWLPEFTIDVDFIGVVGQPTSLGVTNDSIYLEYNGVFRATSRFMFSLATLPERPSNPYIQWSGKVVDVSRDDPDVVFLTPFFEFINGMGYVHYTVIYPSNGRLWVGTDGDGVREYRFPDRTLVRKLKFGVVSNDVRAVAFQGDTLWLGGYGGITAVYDGERHFYTPNGVVTMKCELIRDMAVGRDGIWFATDCNILHRASGMFWSYRTIYEPTCVHFAGNELYIGTDNGMFVLDITDGSISRGDMSITAPVRDIDGPNDRNLMVLTSFGTYWVDDSGAHRVVDPRGWLSGVGFAEKWVGDTGFVVTSDGFLIISGSEIKYENPSFPTASTRVYDIEVTGERVWFATRDGLFYFDRDTHLWGRLYQTDRFPQSEVYAVEAKDDTLFVGTARGLSIITNWREK